MMLIRSMIPFVLIALLYLQGCAAVMEEQPGVSVERTGEVHPKKYQARETFIGAIKDHDHEYYKKLYSLSDEQVSFSKSIHFVMTGKLEEAEKGLIPLYNSAKDPQIRKSSGDILASLFFYQYRWRDLMDRSFYRETAEAFLNVPPETYRFPKNPVSLPVTMIASYPLVEVEINGVRKRLWLDTGASFTALSSYVAKLSGVKALKENGGGKAITASNQLIDLKPAVIDELKLGGIVVKNHPIFILSDKDLEFTVFDSSGGKRIVQIDGFIGWNLLKNMVVELDYRNRRVQFESPVHNEAKERNLFWLGYPIVQMYSQEGTPLNFGLDTGSSDTTLTSAILNKIMTAGPITVERRSVSSVGGVRQVDSHVLYDLTIHLNDYHLHFNSIRTIPLQTAVFIVLDGYLGSDVLRQGKVRIDYMNGRFDFTPMRQ